MGARKAVQELAKKHLDAGDVLGWFEALYSSAGADFSKIPWADLKPNLHLVNWLDRESSTPRRAMAIGCGLGDDAEELSQRGWQVSAFDISTTAIHWCRQRFSQSRCEYAVADVLDPPAQWIGAFDLVFEAYTLQVLPPQLRRKAIANVAKFVAPGGKLLIVCRGRDTTDSKGNMPWPLLRSELDVFNQEGLAEQSFEDFLDDENPRVRRFRAVYVNIRSPEI